MAARKGWTTHIPYQFEPESESEPESEPEPGPESEPEPKPESELEEEAPEQRREGISVQCEQECLPSSPSGKLSDSASGKVNVSNEAHQNPKSPGQRTAAKRHNEDEELSTSLSVGDGRYLVDLGSSSEFIVDEECLLEQFKSCRKCSKECRVRKRVEGLKLVLTQVCFFCANRFTWTNLLDSDDSKDDSDF